MSDFKGRIIDFLRAWGGGGWWIGQLNFSQLLVVLDVLGGQKRAKKPGPG